MTVQTQTQIIDDTTSTAAQDATATATIYKVADFTGTERVPVDHELLKFITRVTTTAAAKGKKPVPTACIVLPILEYDGITGPLSACLNDALSDLRASMIRAAWETGTVAFTADTWSMEKMVEFYTARAVSGRLSKEGIAAWSKEFAATMFGGKGVAEEVVNKKETTFLSIAEKLAAVSPSLNTRDAGLLLAIIQRVPVEVGGLVQSQMVTKLDRILNPATTADLLDAL